MRQSPIMFLILENKFYSVSPFGIHIRFDEIFKITGSNFFVKNKVNKLWPKGPEKNK